MRIWVKLENINLTGNALWKITNMIHEETNKICWSKLSIWDKKKKTKI